MIAWKFPPNQGGEVTGFNNGAIDHFKGHPLSSTVREVLQNSLDAPKLAESEPIKVCFKLHSVRKDDAPQVTSIKQSIEACLARAQAQNLEAAVAFYERALVKIERCDEIPFLAIHDFNSRGLTGEIDSDTGAWSALVKGTGISQKAVGSLGSFGHGSKAPFSLSDIRSIFYLSFVAEEGKDLQRRFQGKSILQTHVDANGEKTQGTGYFGWEENCWPLTEEQIPGWALKMREDVNNEPGTSILIPYFMLGEEELPETAITVIANYYYAISRGNLEVEVCNETLLTEETIRQQYWHYRDRLDDERDYIDADRIKDNFDSLRAVVEPDHEGQQQVQDLGTFSWFIKLSGEQEEKRTRVAVARRDGMLIRHNPRNLERFRRTKPFEMFVCVDGEEGSQLLKSVENPRHDDFEFERLDADQIKPAKAKYKRITDKIREVIKRHAELPSELEILDDTLDWLKNTSVESTPGEGAERSNTLTIGRTKSANRKSSSPLFQQSELGLNVTLSAQGHRSGDGTRKTKSGPFPGPGSGQVVGPGQPTKPKSKKVQVRNLRRVQDASDPKRVKIIFDGLGEGNFQIYVEKIGEDGSTLPVSLISPDGQSGDSVTAALTNASRQALVLESEDPLTEYALVAKYIAEDDEEDES